MPKSAHRRIFVLIALACLMEGSVTLLFRLPINAAWLRSGVSSPNDNEYRVFAGFLDDFVQSEVRAHDIPEGAHIYLLNETLLQRNPGPLIPLEVVALGSKEMAKDFYRRNETRWMLDSNFHSSTVELVSREVARRLAFTQGPTSQTAIAETIGTSESFGEVLAISRPGFNRDRTAAVLYYSFQCGGICARSGWVSLRLANGSWHIEKFGAGVQRVSRKR